MITKYRSFAIMMTPHLLSIHRQTTGSIGKRLSYQIKCFRKQLDVFAIGIQIGNDINITWRLINRDISWNILQYSKLYNSLPPPPSLPPSPPYENLTKVYTEFHYPYTISDPYPFNPLSIVLYHYKLYLA